METKDIWIVIPAYNEEKKIAKVVKSVQAEGFNSIIVVDDGSKDKTYREAKKACKDVVLQKPNKVCN